MLARISQFLAAPAFEDESRTRVAGLLNTILLVVLVLTVLGTAVTVPLEPSEAPLNLTFGVILVALVLWLRFLVRRGHLSIVGTLLALVLWASFTFLAYSGDRVRDPAVSGYFLVITLAVLLLGARGAVVFGLLCVLATAGMLLAEISGLVPVAVPQPVGMLDLFTLVTTFGLVTVLLYFAVRSINVGFERAVKNEHAQREANRELQALRASLEQQVADRTRDLERRTLYLEASADISRAAGSILEPHLLMQQVAELIRERLGFYHVAVFLLNETGQWADYSAGTGEIGQTLLKEKLRIAADERSVTGWCIVHTQARIVQDVRTDPLHMPHSALPRTRSEASLPLLARGQVIGALSVQSDRPETFDKGMIAALQTMVDQVAVAIDNARLFAQSQAALESERRAYGEIARQAWAGLLQSGLSPGYRYADERVEPIGDLWRPEMESALHEGRLVRDSVVEGGQARLTFAVPIIVRGQTIGVIGLRKDAQHGDWTPGELALLEALVEQLGVALDSARLFEDSQRRAAHERMVSELGGRIRESAHVETILKTALRELTLALGADQVAIRLVPGERQAGGAV